MMIRIIICVLSLVVITGWAIVFFMYHEGGFFHLTLVLAVYALAEQWFPWSRTVQKRKQSLKNK